MTGGQGEATNVKDKAHLESACAAIERVLARRHPEHHWIVEIAKDRQQTPADYDLQTPV